MCELETRTSVDVEKFKNTFRTNGKWERWPRDYDYDLLLPTADAARRFPFLNEVEYFRVNVNRKCNGLRKRDLKFLC